MNKKTFIIIAIIAFIAGLIWFFTVQRANASYEVCEDWEKCEYEVTPTPTVEVTPTPECDQDQCITPTEEPTATPSVVPTDTPNQGGQGDGKSDGRSSCPSCTATPNIPAGPPATGRGH